MMRIADCLIDGLLHHGAKAIFGIPGDYALPLFAAVEADGRLPLYCMAHEPALGFAADGAVRSAGGVGVLMVTYGAGALNVLNAVAGAWAERSPLVVISGSPSRADWGSGLSPHHQIVDPGTQSRVFREVTCDQAILTDPVTAPGEIARVLRSAVDRQRPVYIEVPRDMVEAPCGALPATRGTMDDIAAVKACVEEVNALIAGARRPVLMVGVEVRRYGLEAQVADLARRLRVPVVTSFMGRGLLAETGVTVQGCYLGRAGDPGVRCLVEESDGLLLLGVILSDTNFGVAQAAADPRTTVHAYDGRVRLKHHGYDRVSLAGLIAGLAAQWEGAPEPEQAAAARIATPAAPRDNGDLRPDDIARLLAPWLLSRQGTPVVADVGDCLFVATGLPPGPVIAPAYYAGMGFAVPAAMGVQAVTGRRPVVLVGDGAFQMTGLELGNCAQYGWDPLVIVMNNGGWGMLGAFAPDTRCIVRPGWDHAALARSLGGDGYRATSTGSFAAALDAAFCTRGRFQVIDAVLPPLGVSSTMQGFTSAIVRRAAPLPAEG